MVRALAALLPNANAPRAAVTFLQPRDRVAAEARVPESLLESQELEAGRVREVIAAHDEGEPDRAGALKHRDAAQAVRCRTFGYVRDRFTKVLFR